MNKIKKNMGLWALLVASILATGCEKQVNPGNFQKQNVESELSGLSQSSLAWACDEIDVRKINLEGKNLSVGGVVFTSNSTEPHFNVNVNGSFVLVAPKAANIDAVNTISETIFLSLPDNPQSFSLTLTHGRMDKSMIESVTPDELRWDYSETDAKTVTLVGYNFDDTMITVTSDSESSHFNWSISNNVLTITPKGENENTASAVEETLLIVVSGGNSVAITVKQAKAPVTPTVIYSTTFENTDKPQDKLAEYAFITNGATGTYACDGKQWTVFSADVTNLYAWSSKKSHILARVAANSTTTATMTSGNLLDAEVKVTSFSVTLARRNNNDGWCRVEYSLDGTTWKPAGEEFQALLSGSAANEYKFDLNNDSGTIFMIKVSYFFKSAPAGHGFLNFESAKVMGY